MSFRTRCRHHGDTVVTWWGDNKRRGEAEKRERKTESKREKDTQRQKETREGEAESAGGSLLSPCPSAALGSYLQRSQCLLQCSKRDARARERAA